MVRQSEIGPFVFIAKNEPAEANGTITIRIAGPGCIDPESGVINLSQALEETFPYPAEWSHDGRILTKINRPRRVILEKLLAFHSFERSPAPQSSSMAFGLGEVRSAAPPDFGYSAGSSRLSPLLP